MKDFELLKRTYPTSVYERPCDGYEYIVNNYTNEDLIKNKIKLTNLQKTIKIGEKYIYEVAKVNNEFKIMSICFTNFAIIREKLFIFDE